MVGVALTLAACGGDGAGGGGPDCTGGKCDGLADARPDDGAAIGCAEESGGMPDAWIRGGPDCGE